MQPYNVIDVYRARYSTVQVMSLQHLPRKVGKVWQLYRRHHSLSSSQLALSWENTKLAHFLFWMATNAPVILSLTNRVGLTSGPMTNPELVTNYADLNTAKVEGEGPVNIIPLQVISFPFLCHLFNFIMVIGAWNIRGVGRKSFLAEFTHLMILKNLDIVFLSKRKLPSHNYDFFLKRWGNLFDFL